MLYPLVVIRRNLAHIDDQVHRAAAKTIFIVGLSFILTYAPLTLISLVFYPLMALGYDLDWPSVCGAENFFFFLQDAWYVVIPFVILLNDPELGHDFPGKATAIKLTEKVKQRLGMTTVVGSGNQRLQEEESVC